MAIDAKDLGELQKALNEASGKASVLWTTFITFQLYLAIAFGSVTHRDLFLETPIKLPLLNVDLALVGFFVVAPLLLLIFHFYLFLQLLGLASKAKDYNTLLVDKAAAAADKFFPEGGSLKTGHPTYRARTSSPPEIVLRQISGDGAWMNFRFSRALPPGASRSRRDERHSIRWMLPGRTTYLPRPRRRRLRCRRPRKGGRA